jgi:LysM repeat protein
VQHYQVRAGDTLWTIATVHFAGDPREGVWELQQRNRLAGTMIRPGQTLVLP